MPSRSRRSLGRDNLLQKRILSFFRLLFLALILVTAGFLSCLTAMRFAIRGSEVAVPNLIGRSLQEANLQLNAVELRLKVDGRRFDDKTPRERIISQLPSPDSRLKRNRSVKVLVSQGAKKILVPDLRGESLRISQIALLRRGLSLGLVSSVSSDSAEKDRIIAQDPISESQLAQTPLVNVLVSSGRKSQEYLMPELVGRNIEDVNRALQGVGVRLGRLSYQGAPGLVRGTVLQQFPPAGQKIAEGVRVDMEVSR